MYLNDLLCSLLTQARVIFYGDHSTAIIRRYNLGMRFLKLMLLALLVVPAWAGIVENVREALASNSFTAADIYLKSYRNKNGVTPEYVEAYSWMARTALNNRDYDQAQAYAKQTETLALDQIKQHPLDSEPHLPLALGAAIEVESQTLVAKGQNQQAVAVLRTALRTYGDTSIRARLQKNLNLLSFDGKPAPALKSEQFLGSKPPTLAQLKGSPVLLFFWAHWCSDCKAEAPIITKLRAEYASKGLTVLGPTRLYGYTAQVEHATPADELAYIEAVRQRFYSGLLDMSVPISKYNFDTYGASTTPTLVLVDRAGKVAMYHPGALPYDELKAEIEKVVAR
jgi:cytochrome c biogenesis protein CcmG/thiol:disulfide interchange protein DsbE